MEETDMKPGDEVKCVAKWRGRRPHGSGTWTIHQIHLPTMDGETTLVSLRPLGVPKDEDREGWPAYTYCTVDLNSVELVKKPTDDFDWKAAEEAVKHFESLGEWRGKDRRNDPAGDAVLRERLGAINDETDRKHAAVLRKLHDKAKDLAGRK